MAQALSAHMMLALFSVLRLVGYLGGPLLTDEQIHRVEGEPRRVERARTNTETLTVVTWNIARGVDFPSILEQLRTLEADVVLLQEVDRFCGRSGGRDVARDLAMALDMNWVWAGEFQEIGESIGAQPALTGQAVLSRTPIEDARIIPFEAQAGWRWSWNPVQPRRGGRIALRARTSDVVVYNVHLESTGGDRLRANQLEEVVGADAAQMSELALVAGDFNNSRRASEDLLATLAGAGFADALGNRGQSATSKNHDHAIDWIFARGFGHFTGRVRRSTGSDHFTLVGHLVRERVAEGVGAPSRATGSIARP